MKKVIFLFILCLSSIFGAKAQFEWGVRAGLNISELTLKQYSYVKVGPNAGVMGKYTFKNNLRLNTGLLFSIKGANGLDNILNGKSENSQLNFRMSYLELPLTLSYKLKINEQISIVPEAGFFIAYGIDGFAEEHEFRGNTGSMHSSWNPFKGSDWKEGVEMEAFKRWDSGLRFGLSVEVYKFDLGIHYDLGLSHIQNQLLHNTNGLSTRNTALTLGYTF